MNAAHNREIERLYMLMYKKMFAYARSTLRSASLAEEAVQETFRIACQKPEELCASENPQGWLINTLKYVICNMERSRNTAHHILMDYLSAQIKQGAFSEDRISFELQYENVADSEEFKLIKEMAIDGKSHLEMAQARGISVDACKKRVQRAKEVLRKKIKD